MAALLAVAGSRVGVVDMNLQAPEMHLLLEAGEPAPSSTATLPDYLLGSVPITDCVYDSTAHLQAYGSVAGALLFVPASSSLDARIRLMRKGYDAEHFAHGINTLTQHMALDVLLIDTNAGLSEETLLAMALCDVLGAVMNLDTASYQGTGVTVEVVRKLAVPRILLIINEAPDYYQPADIRQQMQRIYGCEVAAILPHFDDLQALGNARIFALAHPIHPFTTLLKELASVLLA
jgi:MinD-like ATPase involved in chromosome partitioning or flagellar assembly